MFPKYLDEAEILWHTEKGNYGFTKYNTGEIDEKICYFAIAKYKGDNCFYLFGCNSNFDVITDDLCDSVEECKKTVFNYGYIPIWYKY